MNRRRTSAFIVTAGLAVAVAAPARADTVVLENGKRFSNCKVLSEDAQQVQIDTDANGSADQKIPSEQVADIQYAARSLEYRQAEVFFKSGDFAKAEAAFKAIMEKEVGSTSWTGAYAGYYRAVALQRWAETDSSKAAAAVEALKEFVGFYKNSRFTNPARLSLARVYMVQEKYDDVRKMVEQVISAKGGTSLAVEGRLLLARVKVKQGDPASAEKDFDAVLKSLKTKGSPAWAEAMVGKGLAQLAKGQLKQAETLLADLIETTNDSGIRARAYNALGDAYFKKGKFAEARLKYLRVVVLYFRADAVEHAKALFGSAQCFAKLGDQKRANDLYRELVRLYPGSPWAAKSPIKPDVEEPVD